MTGTPDHDRQMARQARLAAFTIAGTMILWMGVQWLGGKLGWETRYAFLFDLAAGAAFLWTLVVTFRIWRRGKSDRQGN